MSDNLSPLLQRLRQAKQEQISKEVLPEQYFEQLSANLMTQIQTTATVPQDITPTPLRVWYRRPLVWSAAASVLLLMGLGIWFFKTPNTLTTSQPSNNYLACVDIQTCLSDIDTKDIGAYLEQGSEGFATEADEEDILPENITVPEDLAISDKKAVEDYLEEEAPSEDDSSLF